MGKKNLLKSTTKKKGTKKTAAKKPVAKKSTPKKIVGAKKAETEAKAEAEAKAKAEAEAKAKAAAEVEAKAKAEVEAKAKAEVEAKAKAEVEAKAKAEAEAKAKAEAEAEAEAKAAANRIEAEDTPPIPPPPSIGESDTVKKLVKGISICLILIILPIIYASISNTTNYYLKTSNGALEIWQGNFSPMGEHMVITIPGAVPPETIKKVYSKNEAFPLVCNYFIEKSDAILNIAGIPDFKAIRNDLEKAMTYAITEELRLAIDHRLTSIAFITFMYNADISAAKGTSAGFEAAAGYLEEASRLDLDDQQATLVENKIKTFRNAAESAAAEESAALEAEASAL
ncbi:MAG: hypothetical protein JRF40_06255 [Deltaproteobacteria bacterium]|nr:hypothetical protein [Deltaproteobacteria bacterium]